MKIRTQISVGLATLMSLGALAALMSAAALGALTHPYAGQSFGPSGLGSAGFSIIQGVTVDQTSGDVYVYDGGLGSVLRFDSGGEPVSFSALGTNTIPGAGYDFGGANGGLALDGSSGPASGDIYVANGEALLIYGRTGVKLGELPISGACGVAVDSAGAVYVAISGSGVRQYTPTANPLTSADYSSTLSGIGNVCGIAVGSDGSLYTSSSSGPVTRYEASQFNTEEKTAVGTQIDALGGNVAVDATSNGDDLYVDEGADVAQYDATGKRLGVSGTTGPGALNGSYGLALNHSGGELYASAGSVINIYNPAVVVADVTTEAALGVAKATAVVNGSINPLGTSVSACDFEYGPEAGVYTETAPCAEAMPVSGSHTVPASAALSGLNANSVYHYRLRATNANGDNVGQDRTFSTAQAVDALSTGSASNVTGSTADLSGSLSPDGADTHYYFEYGADESYGSTSPALPGTDAGSGSVRVPATTSLSGLALGQTYHYRLVGVNTFGTTYGEDQTFTTSPAVGEVLTTAAGGIGGTDATLNGTLNPGGLETHYHFEYGSEESYGASTPAQDAGAGHALLSVSSALVGLIPNRVYHYRLVAENSLGTTYGGDRTLRTLVLLPILEQSGSTAVSTRSNVLLAFTLNSGDNNTAYHLEYGMSAAYGSTTQTSVLAGGTTGELVQISLEDLVAGTPYHYRLIATNAAGTVVGPDETFTTLAATPPLVSTAAPVEVGQNSATISGNVDAQGEVTNYGFEVDGGGGFGLPTGLGSFSSGEEEISLTLAGLQPGTTYHYRVVASNLDGTTYGSEQTFTTTGVAIALTVPPAAPLIATPAVVFPTDKATVTTPKAKPKKKRAKKPKRRTKKKR